jgi:hypothetical protein
VAPPLSQENAGGSSEGLSSCGVIHGNIPNKGVGCVAAICFSSGQVITSETPLIQLSSTADAQTPKADAQEAARKLTAQQQEDFFSM